MNDFTRFLFYIISAPKLVKQFYINSDVLNLWPNNTAFPPDPWTWVVWQNDNTTEGPSILIQNTLETRISSTTSWLSVNFITSKVNKLFKWCGNFTNTILIQWHLKNKQRLKKQKYKAIKPLYLDMNLSPSIQRTFETIAGLKLSEPPFSEHVLFCSC